MSDLLQVLGQASTTALEEVLRLLARCALPGVRKKYPSTRQRLAQAAQRLQQVRLTNPLGYLRRAGGTLAAKKRAFAQYLERTELSFDAERLICQRTVSMP